MFNPTFYGHPNFEPTAVDSALRADLKSAGALDGEFAVAARADGLTSLFCSADGVTQLFYTVRNGALHYGTTVAAVMDAAGLAWEWDYQALAEFAVFGHLIGSKTLHPAIHRVGSAELVTWNGCSLSVSAVHLGCEPFADPVQAAIDALLDRVRLLSHPDDVISMSAGFDSRLILAAFLALGLRPNLVVMGAEESTDVAVASEIARAFQLPLEWIPLSGARMISDRSLISRVTSGTKAIDNWHTYEYVAASSRADGTGVWIGTNGEYTRTLYFDRGVPFVVANALGRAPVRKFWEMKAARNAVPPALGPFLEEELVDRLRPEVFVERLLSVFAERSLGDVNDHLYLERVRQFQANGLRLVSLRYTPKIPFLHSRWLAAVKQMPRAWKLGNRWHRHAIKQLCPRLLTIPYNATGVPMGQAPGWEYWLGLVPYCRNIPYFDYDEFVQRQAFRDVYEKSTGALTGIARDNDNGVLLREWPLRTTAFVAALGFHREMQQLSRTAEAP